MSFTGKRTPVTPGAIFRGSIYRHRDYPGVAFVYPWDSEASGRPVTTKGGWPGGIVVVEDDVPDELAVAAAAFAGRMSRSAGMRRAAMAWLHSRDHDRNPHKQASVDVA